MQRYFIRGLKATLMFFMIGTLIHVLIYLIGNDSEPKLSFMEFIRKSDITSISIFFAVFGMAYPLIGFVKQTVYASKPFDEYKQEVVRMFTQVNFVLVSDKDKKMVFRSKSALTRLLRLYEDTIVLDYSDSPIVLKGLRRDVCRLSRMIESHIRNNEQED